MVRVRLVRSSYLAYFYLDKLQPVKVILSGGQILKLLPAFVLKPVLVYEVATQKQFMYFMYFSNMANFAFLSNISIWKIKFVKDNANSIFGTTALLVFRRNVTSVNEDKWQRSTQRLQKQPASDDKSRRVWKQKHMEPVSWKDQTILHNNYMGFNSCRL